MKVTRDNNRQDSRIELSVKLFRIGSVQGSDHNVAGPMPDLWIAPLFRRCSNSRM